MVGWIAMCVVILAIGALSVYEERQRSKKSNRSPKTSPSTGLAVAKRPKVLDLSGYGQYA